jgi:site-specific DNA-methyltransferase (adenine-specific)
MMNIVYNMDCMEGMKQYPDKHFDLGMVDPPYFSGPEKRGYYGRSLSTTKVKRINYPKTKSWEVPNTEYFLELERVSHHVIIWGCNYYSYPFGPGRIIWDKCNQGSTFSDAEIAYTDLHDSGRLFRYMWNGMQQGKSITEGHIMQGNKSLNEKRIHPTQKPVALYKWTIKEYAKPGWKVLSTHVGSGSDRIACYDAGIDFTGFEIDPVIYQGQETRFQQHIAQLDWTKEVQHE